MDMDDDNEFMRAWLEKQMLGVTEENVDLLTTVVPIPYTILMNVYLTGNAFTVHRGPNKDIVESSWLAVCSGEHSEINTDFKELTSNLNELVLLDHIFKIFLLLFATRGTLPQFRDLLCDILHPSCILRTKR